MKLSSFIISSLTLLSGTINATLAKVESFRNVNLARTIDLSDPAKVKDLTSLVILNEGSEIADKYYFTLNSKVNSSIASLMAQTKTEKKALSIIKDSYNHKSDLQYYFVELSPPLRPGGKLVINFFMTRLNSVEPFPDSSEQSEPQLLRFKENLYFSTPYPSDVQKITVKVPNFKLIEVSEEPKPFSKESKALVYGPYKDLSPFPESELSVHFNYKKPLVYARSIFRDLEVSHWGSNLAVEEHYNVGNFGPKVNGEFSNIMHRKLEVIRSTERYASEFNLVIPKGASDPYYRDEIGNVSTSNFRSGPKECHLRLQPRYPLYGGWNYTWNHGYNLPLSSFLFYNSEEPTRFTLKVPFLRPVADIGALYVTLHVILPEGASLVNVKPLPFDNAVIEYGHHFTYFDTIGRPTVLIHRANVFNRHWKDIEIEYTYEPYNLLRKPLAIFLVFLGFFFTFSVIGRLNLTLDSIQNKSKLKVKKNQ